MFSHTKTPDGPHDAAPSLQQALDQRLAPNIHWQQDWDAALGLWSKPDGHTRPVAHLSLVHAAPDNANRLLLAAQAGQLDRIDVDRILARLREMQVVDGGPLHGCLRWYWEEPKPVDTNAAFFTGLSLIAIWQAYRDALTAAQRELLFAILHDLAAWFRHAAAEKSWFYPNKFLGDLACGWLLWEICDAGPDEAAELSEVMQEAANYWRDHEWGWGEHLSDSYAKVCLLELSALLLLSQRLPEQLRADYQELFDELLAIEDAFKGGARVPALRSYAFLECPEFAKHSDVRNFRDFVVPLPATIDLAEYANLPHLGHTFHQLGWHRLAKARPPHAATVSIPCFGQATARAFLADDIRLGSVSRFPLMPTVEHFTHGLSWQSMPVALARPGKTWAYLQWQTREADRIRAHPAEQMKSGFLGNALTEVVHPPLVGRTWTIHHGGTVVALRIMPALSMLWEELTDRFRIVGDAGTIAPGPVSGTWRTLQIRWPERTLGLWCLPLSDGLPPTATASPDAPVLRRDRKVTDWDMTSSQVQLAGKRMVISLWILDLDPVSSEAPCLTQVAAEPAIPRSAAESVWELTWARPDRQWRLKIDPLAEIALCEIDLPAPSPAFTPKAIS